MNTPKLLRHPGLVPGSTVPRTNGAWIKRNSGCRNKALLSVAEGPGMTEGKGA